MKSFYRRLIGKKGVVGKVDGYLYSSCLLIEMDLLFCSMLYMQIQFEIGASLFTKIIDFDFCES